jgi:hypothetical protein
MKPAAALKDIKEFIKKTSLDSSTIEPSDKRARSLYRRFHALLIWDYLVDRDDFDAITRLYTRECVSDISTAYFLTSIGVYKAARLSLRSGIENAFRVTIADAGCEIGSIATVPDLVNSAKKVAKTDPQKNRIDILYEIYGRLCLTVHSAEVRYMSLKVPFEKILETSVDSAKENYFELDNTLKRINEALFIALGHHLHLIDFKNADLLRDAVEAVVKGEAAALYSL